MRHTSYCERQTYCIPPTLGARDALCSYEGDTVKRWPPRQRVSVPPSTFFDGNPHCCACRASARSRDCRAIPDFPWQRRSVPTIHHSNRVTLSAVGPSATACQRRPQSLARSYSIAKQCMPLSFFVVPESRRYAKAEMPRMRL